MPKILRVINRFNLGGPIYNAAYLTKYLAPEFTTLLVGGMKEESEQASEFIAQNLGVDYRIIPEMRRAVHPVSDFSAYNKIKTIIREFKPDIVHTHAAKAGALGRLAALSCRVPVIVHTFHGHVFHSYFGSFETAAYKKVERYLAKKTSGIIAISEAQKDELVNVHRIAPAEKVHLIPLGFDLQRFNDNLEEKRKDFRAKHNLTDEVAIGIVGRLVAVKNHGLFLEAIRFVSAKSRQKIRAFIIGDGEERQNLESKAADLLLNACSNGQRLVEFISWEREVDKVYPGLDVVCLTSFNEGTPVSLIEAQAAGRPIVSTNVGGIENVVLPNRTALLSAASDKQKFFENLLKLVEEETLRYEMSKEGWNHVREKFHYTRLVGDVRRLYETLIAQAHFAPTHPTASATHNRPPTAPVAPGRSDWVGFPVPRKGTDGFPASGSRGSGLPH